MAVAVFMLMTNWKGEYLFATYAAGVGKQLEDVFAWDGKSWEMS